GSIAIKGKVVLAPMTPVTDLPFRLLCREIGASLAFTEMVNVNAVNRGNKAARANFKTVAGDRPLGIQLIGTQPEKFVATARYIVDSLDSLDGVFLDINLDCPDTAVINQGAGAALLKRPDRISALIGCLKTEFSIPVTVKMRLTSMESALAVKTARNIEVAGADAIAVHGRTIAQKNDGDTRWDIIKAIKDAVLIPVIGSGGIYSPECLTIALESSRCDAVMIGKPAIYNPGIFQPRSPEEMRWRVPSTSERLGWLQAYYIHAERYDCVKKQRVLQRARDFFKGMFPESKINNLYTSAKDMPAFLESLGNLEHIT
nr:tRNA-dihydrouridine synthase family protein [Candidatus Sigynarchaeota archaeon]